MPRRRWLKLGWRVLRLFANPPVPSANLVSRSYDRVAEGYDEVWTHHMRDLSVELVRRLAPPPGAACVDLACGTGFVTRELAERTQGSVIGVDTSSGMLQVARRQGHQVARQQAHPRCEFVQADAVAYLRSCPTASLDAITCAWALGYTQPWVVVREARRVLRPGGRIAIIDNTLFSLAEVLWASILTFAERPEDLAHVLRVRFLPGVRTLRLLMRLAGFAIVTSWKGAVTYYVPDGQAAIARLTATGAAAGFEFAARNESRDAVFARFAEILSGRAHGDSGIAITHRYLAAVGRKR